MSDVGSVQKTLRLSFVKYPYDNVHGYIGLTEAERSIIDTQIFQRLRRVRHLGVADLVYPGATQTRFSHSLGSVFIMDRVADRLIADNYLKHEDLEKLRLAALLHDVGHYPFSHVIEKLMRELNGDNAKHEAMSAHFIKNSEIAAVLNRFGYDPDEIAAIIKRRSGNKLFNYLVSSDLDVDRMDYLLRDAYHTGVAYGSIDIDRLIQTITVNEETGAQLAVLGKGRQAVENFLIGRYHMYQSVYYHKTVIAFELMLQAIYRALLGSDACPDFAGIKKMSAEQLAGFDDSWVWRGMCHYSGELKFVKQLIDMLCRRISLKVAYEEPSLKVGEGKSSAWKILTVPLQKQLLSKESGVGESWIFFSEPPPVEVIISDDPETAVYIRKDEKGERYLRLIQDDTSIVHHLAGFGYLTPRVYTREEYKDKLETGLRKCYDLPG